MARSNYVELKIGDTYNNMTTAEKTVADYVLSNLQDIPFLSIKELACQSSTSEATIIRFCKTIGFKGFRDFTITLSSVLGGSIVNVEPENREYTDIQMGDSLETIMKNVSYNSIRSLEDSLAVLDKVQLEEAVSIICNTQNVCWFGIEASGIVCKDAELKFTRINKPFRAFVDAHSIKIAASLLSENDAAVFVSNSGDTPEILDGLDLAKKTGAKIIAITRYSNSKLALKADVCLRISTPEITFRSAAMGSRIAMLNVIDILFSSVASETYDNVKGFLDKTRNAIQYRKN